MYVVLILLNFDCRVLFLDLDLYRTKMLDPDPHWDQCGSQTLLNIHVPLLSIQNDFFYPYPVPTYLVFIKKKRRFYVKIMICIRFRSVRKAPDPTVSRLRIHKLKLFILFTGTGRRPSVQESGACPGIPTIAAMAARPLRPDSPIRKVCVPN